MSRPKILVIVGPTASGKSELAFSLAREAGGEIISADSMQVYRGLDIGTAKPSQSERREVPHHLIDIVDPDEPYSAGRFQAEAGRAIREAVSRGALPIVAGGSGLYINTITHGLDLAERPQADPEVRRQLEGLAPEELYSRLLAADPGAAQRIHLHNVIRVRRALEIAQVRSSKSYDFERIQPEFDPLILGISWPRSELYARINDRTDAMFAQGLADEVRSLYARYGPEPVSMQAIGYKEIVAHLEGRIQTLDEAADLIRRNTRRFAKRQLTWFRRDPRIHWLEPSESLDRARELLRRHRTEGNEASCQTV